MTDEAFISDQIYISIELKKQGIYFDREYTTAWAGTGRGAGIEVRVLASRSNDPSSNLFTLGKGDRFNVEACNCRGAGLMVRVLAFH